MSECVQRIFLCFYVCGEKGGGTLVSWGLGRWSLSGCKIRKQWPLWRGLGTAMERCWCRVKLRAGGTAGAHIMGLFAVGG